jgi:hypothetical protein
MLLLMWRERQPAVVLLGALGMILFVPLKMRLDKPRREQIASGIHRALA